MRRRPARHDDRLSVMRNHAGHKIDIGIAVWLINSERPFLGRRLVNGFLILRVYQLASPHCVVAAGGIPHEDQCCHDALRKCLSHSRSSAIETREGFLRDNGPETTRYVAKDTAKPTNHA